MQHRLLRAARVTKHLPIFKGLSALLWFYRRVATRDLMPITDFDGDLKLEISVCETMGINLWHTPKLFEKEERRAFCSAITPGCNVLDVGAISASIRCWLPNAALAYSLWKLTRPMSRVYGVTSP
jgi:hypothetical protein